MAFINVNEMEKKEKDIRKQEPVKATYTINNEKDGFLFQIDTYGRDSRANPDKVSQSISFDSDNLHSFIKLLKQEFPSLFKKVSVGEEKILVDQDEKGKFLFDSLAQGHISPLILYGPPGTGKTYRMQQEYIGRFPEENRFVTTFHQSFSYEEFVEGLKPVISEKSVDTEQEANQPSDVKYTIEKGIFYKACGKTCGLFFAGSVRYRRKR